MGYFRRRIAMRILSGALEWGPGSADDMSDFIVGDDDDLPGDVAAALGPVLTQLAREDRAIAVDGMVGSGISSDAESASGEDLMDASDSEDSEGSAGSLADFIMEDGDDT
jgi:hypothetical protein